VEGDGFKKVILTDNEIVVDVEELNLGQHHTIPGHRNLKLLDSWEHQYGRNVVASGTV
jgi:hypothetical protein